MRAVVGDDLVRLGRYRRRPEILGSVIEVPNGDGRPPYVVKFHRDGREALISPAAGSCWVRARAARKRVVPDPPDRQAA